MPGISKRITALAALCLLATAGWCLAATPMREARRENTRDASAQAAESAGGETESEAPADEASAPEQGEVDGQPLFPELESARIESVLIYTPSRTFQFRCEDEGERVSVNEHEADGEVFDKLVEQILSCSFEPSEPFTAQEEPVLTITVSTQQEEYSARFYVGDDEGWTANVVSEWMDEPQYLTTEAWRVGTMLLTCEGTRIFDENGEETPAQ